MIKAPGRLSPDAPNPKMIKAPGRLSPDALARPLTNTTRRAAQPGATQQGKVARNLMELSACGALR